MINLPVMAQRSCTLGLKLEVLYARDDTEIETAFATLVQKRVDALVVVTDTVVNNRRAQLVALTAPHMLPSIFPFREFATAGGADERFDDAYRQVGIYTGRILKGEKPADLPVIQFTKVELVINVRTAKTSGASSSRCSAVRLLGRSRRARRRANECAASAY